MRYYKSIRTSPLDFNLRVIYYQRDYGLPYKVLGEKIIGRNDSEYYQYNYGVPTIKTGVVEISKEEMFLELL